MKKIIKTEKAPKAIGPYSQGVYEEKTGLIFTAMQIGIDPATGEIINDDIISQTKQIFSNLQNILETGGTNMDKVLKATLYFRNLNDFTKVNELYGQCFVENYPARSAVEVSNLPKNALIGIELIAYK